MGNIASQLIVTPESIQVNKQATIQIQSIDHSTQTERKAIET